MRNALMLGLCALAVGCNSPVKEDAKQDGLTFTSQENDRVAGVYTAGGIQVSFESALVNGTKYLRLHNAKGEELVSSEINGDSYKMWHRGVLMVADLNGTTTQPEAKAWLESDEAQLVASLWREINETKMMELSAIKPLYEYGIHLDEVLGLKAQEASAQAGSAERDHCTGGCYGQCGPSCFSWGTNSYCKAHDCCCRHYGSGACYTWCFVNPLCLHPGTC
jgi:hypothetical protein